MMEKKSHGAPEEQRLVPRFPLPREQVKFFFDDFEAIDGDAATKPRVFAVRDISINGIGIGLLEIGEALLFPVHSFCRAELKIAGIIVTVRLKVARIGAWSIGFVFVDLPEDIKNLISTFIHPLRIGKSMKAVAVNLAPAAFAAGISNWYHGESATDLYFWSNARGGVERVLLCMGQKFWEWDDRADNGAKVRTGTLDFLETDKVDLHFDKSISQDIQGLAIKVLEHTEVLDYRLVNFLKDQTFQE